MVEMNPNTGAAKLIEGAAERAAGRSFDQQVEWIRKYANYRVPLDLRSRLLHALGIPRPKPIAGNIIKLGCMVPFSSPQYVQGCFKLLDLLGVDYTYLEKEYCCGASLVYQSKESEREKVLNVAREFTQMNRDLAQRRGAGNIVYLCASCAHFAKGVSCTDAADHHMYIWDLIADKLESKTLRVTPTTAAYYSGCGGSSFRAFVPGARLQWKKYRQMMNRIEGLTLVDLKGVCCQVGAERVVEEAQVRHLDTIICACHGCRNRIDQEAGGKVQVKYLSDVLLAALAEKKDMVP